jgi:hypothetical protein
MESLTGNNAAFRLSSSVMSTDVNTSTSMTTYQLDLLTPVHQQLSLQQGKTPNPDWLLRPPHQLPPQPSKFFNSGLPMWPPDEFPSRHLGIDEHLAPAALGSTTVLHQDQDAPLQQQAASSVPMPVPVQGSSRDMEARTKLQEKREEAKQRYKDKRKNRRYVLIYKAINIIKYYSQLSYVHPSICHTQSTPILKMMKFFYKWKHGYEMKIKLLRI